MIDGAAAAVAKIPAEALAHIFTYLAPNEVASCAAISALWRETALDDSVWFQLCSYWIPKQSHVKNMSSFSAMKAWWGDRTLAQRCHHVHSFFSSASPTVDKVIIRLYTPFDASTTTDFSASSKTFLSHSCFSYGNGTIAANFLNASLARACLNQHRHQDVDIIIETGDGSNYALRFEDSRYIWENGSLTVGEVITRLYINMGGFAHSAMGIDLLPARTWTRIVECNFHLNWLESLEMEGSMRSAWNEDMAHLSISASFYNEEGALTWTCLCDQASNYFDCGHDSSATGTWRYDVPLPAETHDIVMTFCELTALWRGKAFVFMRSAVVSFDMMDTARLPGDFVAVRCRGFDLERADDDGIEYRLPSPSAPWGMFVAPNPLRVLEPAFEGSATTVRIALTLAMSNFLKLMSDVPCLI